MNILNFYPTIKTDLFIFDDILGMTEIQIHPRAQQKISALSFTYDILSNQRSCLKFAHAGWLMAQI